MASIQEVMSSLFLRRSPEIHIFGEIVIRGWPGQFEKTRHRPTRLSRSAQGPQSLDFQKDAFSRLLKDRQLSQLFQVMQPLHHSSNPVSVIVDLRST